MSLSLRVGLVLGLGACQAALPPSGETGNSVISERPGALLDVGGHSLHVDCRGQGTEVVVLEAGAGRDGTDWDLVAPELRRFAKTCAYDRAGLGLSPPLPRPHTTQQMVGELHALLERAAPADSYVLVGHSLGGLLARLYAAEYPGSVRGIVLVDPMTEEQALRMWSLLPPERVATFQQASDESPEGLDYASLQAGMDRLRAADRSLGDLPLVVLTAGAIVRPPPPPEPALPSETAERIARVWFEMHDEVSRLSSNGVHIVIEESGHDIQTEAPQFVIAAVREVLLSARMKRPVVAANVVSVARAQVR